MAQITLRGMDPEVEKAIRRMSRQSGKSLNRIILNMIYQYKDFMDGNKGLQADSLRKLAGGWSDHDASEFLEAIKSCEQIDGEMWR